MQLNAIGVTTAEMRRTVQFYTILGLKFPELKETDGHIESIHEKAETKLMIDKKDIVREIIGKDPLPGNHSVFAIEYDTTQEIDTLVKQLEEQGFSIIKAPWDAFWGQHYAVVADPDGYMVGFIRNY